MTATCETGADSQEDYAGRLSALYAPTDDLDVYVWLHGAKKDGKSPNLVRRGFNGGTFDGNPNAFNTSDPWDDRIDPGAPTASPQDFENMVLGAQVDWDLGDARLTYIPGYFYLDWSADYWLENIPALLTAHYNQVTNELRLASDTDSKLQWLGGLYAYQVTNSGDFIVGGFPLSQISRNRLEGYAAFGEATYSLTDAVRVTAGARFSWDQREGEGPDGVRRAVLGRRGLRQRRLEAGRRTGPGRGRDGVRDDPDRLPAGHVQRVSGHARAVQPGAVGDDDGVHDRHQESFPRRSPAGQRRDSSITTTKTCWCSRST